MVIISPQLSETETEGPALLASLALPMDPADTLDAEGIALESLVCHREFLDADQPLEAAQQEFRRKQVEYMAVVRRGGVIGLCARGQLAFVMSARFGFALYSQKPVETMMVDRPMFVARGTPVRAVLDRVFSRSGGDFHEDVVLIDGDGCLLGLIKVETLARLQSRLVAEQVDELRRQQETLRQQNLELFRANHAARQSLGLFTGLFENHALGVALLDTTGSIRHHNRRLAELLNRADGELDDGALIAAVEGRERPAFLTMLEAHAEGTLRAVTQEYTLDIAGRGERRFRCSTGWVRETGEVCACLEDVSEQRALERSMLRQEKQLLLDTMVGGIAHELNNKLMPVIGFAELLAQECEGERHEYLEIIMKSVGESARIVRQLQEMSRPSLPVAGVCDLRTVVAEVLVMLRFALRDARCQVREAMPPEAVSVAADAGQLKQVVMNLAVNALHAMDTQARPLLVLTVRRDGDRAELTVEDNGCGISPANLGRIFDPFFTTKGPERGTGLGLSICDSIVRQHGGEIRVESREGEGTRFTVALAAHEGSLPEAPREGIRGGGTRPPDGLRVLVVEDELVLRRLMQEMLRVRFGCQVDLAPGGGEGLELAAREDYALVISDIRMPEMNGAEFFQRLRQRRPEYAQRFVFVTGYPGDNQHSEAIGRCNVPVLGKPFTVDQLADLCRPYLENGPSRERQAG